MKAFPLRVGDGRHAAATGASRLLLWAPVIAVLWYLCVVEPMQSADREERELDEGLRLLAPAVRHAAADEPEAARLVVQRRAALPLIERVAPDETARPRGALRLVEDSLRLGAFDANMHVALVEELAHLQRSLLRLEAESAIRATISRDGSRSRRPSRSQF